MSIEFSLHHHQGRVNRRRFLQLGGALVASSAVNTLNIPQIYATQINQGIDCPIYTFHETSEEDANLVEQTLVDNLQNDRKPITVSELARILAGKRKLPSYKIFCMSFDDRLKSQYDHALPILNKYNVPATFYVMSSGWSGDGVHKYMEPEQLVEIAQRHEIGCHTINHPKSLPELREFNWGSYLDQIYTARKELESLVGKQVTTFAYPYGVFDKFVQADLVKLGYTAAVSTIRGNIQVSDIRYELRRIPVT